jgi:hypothetical protein
MKLTKDESRVLAAALGDYKYTLVNDASHPENLMTKLNLLEQRLETYGKDKRRKGRTTQDNFNDLLKRFDNSKQMQI